MDRVKRVVWIAIVIVCAIRLPQLYAQSTKVELSGLVRDPAELPVQGADVRLVNTGTEVEQAFVTGADGRYHFFALPPGTYTISVRRSGSRHCAGTALSCALETRSPLTWPFRSATSPNP